MNMDLYDTAFNLIRENNDSEARQRGLKMLKSYVDQYPDNAKAWFEYAGAFDYLGDEKKAASLYEKTLALGVNALPTKDQPCFYLQYGSTLRNLKKFTQADQIFITGITKHPGFTALKLFHALNQISQNIDVEENKSLIKHALQEAKDPSIIRYQRALKAYFKLLN